MCLPELMEISIDFSLPTVTMSAKPTILNLLLNVPQIIMVYMCMYIKWLMSCHIYVVKAIVNTYVFTT